MARLITAAPGFKAELKESLRWYNVHLRGDHAALRSSPIRIYVMGINKWADQRTTASSRHE